MDVGSVDFLSSKMVDNFGSGYDEQSVTTSKRS